MTDADVLEEARRSLGRRLAAHRRAAGYSQAQFAPLTGYGRSTVANVETGRQSPPRDFWQRCDAALSARGSLTAAHDDIEAAVREQRLVASREEQAVRAGNIRSPLIEDREGGVDWLWPVTVAQLRHRAAELWSQDFHALSGEAEMSQAAIALRWLVAPPDLTAAHAGWQRVGGSDVRRLRAIRRNLKALDNTHGGGAAFPLAVSFLRHEAGALLKGHYNEAIGRELLGATAELALDVGWMTYDAGDHALAARYMAQALRLSHAAGDRILGGRVLAAMSHQAAHLGRYTNAVDLSQAAQAGTRHIATPTVLAMLAAMEACALAGRGDRRASAKALLEAEQALEAARPDDPDPDWLDFDEGGLWGHAARVYRDVHQPAETRRYAELAVGRCRADHGRTRAQRRAILAAAHIEAGDTDQAAAIGLTIVQDAWTLTSRHVYEEVAVLHRRLDASA